MNIDVPVPQAVQDALNAPKCVPLPKVKKAKLRLPLGGTITAIPDITKGIPSDCSMNFNLALQIAPILASIECLVKVLGFVGALVKALEKLPGPPPDLPGFAAAIPEVLEKAKPVLECVAQITTGPIPFIKDLLLMLARLLKCAAQALRSAIAIMDGIELQLNSARMNGNDELVAQLECARENAEIAMAGQMVAIDPVFAILELAGPFFDLAGVPMIQSPQIAPDGTLQGFKDVLQVIEDLAATLETVAESVPA
jgi:hypothetical protein